MDFRSFKNLLFKVDLAGMQPQSYLLRCLIVLGILAILYCLVF